MKNADGVDYETPWAVVCDRHGVVCLDETDYDTQLGDPNGRWRCPKCGDVSEWDDECPETNPKEEE